MLGQTHFYVVYKFVKVSLLLHFYSVNLNVKLLCISIDSMYFLTCCSTRFEIMVILFCFNHLPFRSIY
jgi:hypothetical protein